MHFWHKVSDLVRAGVLTAGLGLRGAECAVAAICGIQPDPYKRLILNNVFFYGDQDEKKHGRDA